MSHIQPNEEDTVTVTAEPLQVLPVEPVELVYKYPELIELYEKEIFRKDPVHINPHADLNGFAAGNPVDPYWLSRHSSNVAVEVLTDASKFVNLKGLVLNTNPNIGPLLEQLHVMPKHQKKDWSNFSKSQNPAVLSFLERHPERIDWIFLSLNRCEGAVRILEKHPNKIAWNCLCTNPFAIELLRANLDRFDYTDWVFLAENPHLEAIEMVQQKMIEEPNRLHMGVFFKNPHPRAIKLISEYLRSEKYLQTEKSIRHCLMSRLSENPNPAVCKLLEENPNLCNFASILKNPGAIDYIEKRIHMIGVFNFAYLCENPNCVPVIYKMLQANLLLPEHLEMMGSDTLYNVVDSIYELDYQAMSSARSRIIDYEIELVALHPTNVDKWLDYFLKNGGPIKGGAITGGAIEDFDWI